ncbi:MAG TPA: phosphatase PAP2 family protein [Gaiellaceae bacterium]|nr:phosphatase PAP2 family protein [Gaiellaceae bacterium]
MIRAIVRWAGERHSLVAEAALVAGLYAVYQVGRGFAVGGRDAAVDHAHTIASVERSLRLFDEPRVQAAVRHVPELVGTLGVLYLTLHLAATGLYLLWLHRRRARAFPTVRTALVIASGLALVGFLLFPTAPPRLAGVGLVDTISRGGFGMDHGLVSALYNPFAAIPSIHICYAGIVGASLWRHGRHPASRVLGVLYPSLQLLVVVATGNHFFFDAAAGLAVAALAVAAARVVVEHPARVRLSALAEA